MFPDAPMQPGPGESALTLELGIIVLAIGVVVFLVIVGKLAWEWRRSRREDDAEFDA